MNNEIIRNCILFRDLSGDELSYATEFFGARKRDYRKGELLNHLGEPLPFFGLVLSGSIRVSMYDIDGNSILMATAGPGSTFGESLCFLKREANVQIECLADSQILRMNTDRVNHGATQLDQELSHRFTAMLAGRTLSMNDRIQVLSRTTIREKLITLFSQYSDGSGKVTLPMDRAHMAAYLGVNRTALSRELSRMQEEGLIQYNKNQFQLRCNCN